MPRKCELYRHFSAEGDLLYVGISFNAVARACSHQAYAQWFDRVVRIEIERFETREAARAAEIVAIREEGPKFNRADLLKPKPDPRFRKAAATAIKQALIAEAERANVRINRNWSPSVLRHVMKLAKEGRPYTGDMRRLPIA